MKNEKKYSTGKSDQTTETPTRIPGPRETFSSGNKQIAQKQNPKTYFVSGLFFGGLILAA